jgi:RNA recognition motif-containing protein
MAKTLYVGNLPWTIKDQDLATAFEQVAPIISARVMTERETGRSRGFGFVECDDENAQKLIDAMNGKDLGGRAITVNEARPKTSRA